MKIHYHLLTCLCAAAMLGGQLPAAEGVRDWTPGLADPTPTPVLKRSHVAIWFDEPEDHLKYDDVDVIVQDLDITDEADVPAWKALVDRWHAQGKLFFAEVRPATPLGKTFETLMDDPGLRESGIVNFEGRFLAPKWQSGRTHKGHPVRFFCSNNPRYRSFLRYLIYLYHEAGADGLFVDDVGGNPKAPSEGGCLCPYCIARFRTYLREKYPPEQWRALQFGDLDTFDYKQVVRSHATDLESFAAARRAGTIPLMDEFADFQWQSDVELFKSLHAEMDKLCGRHVPMAWDNFNYGASRMPYYPTLDALAPEINFGLFATGEGDNTRLPRTTVMLNRLSDSLGKWYSPIPAPPTWRVNKAQNLTGLLRLWVAATYANGGLPRYPRKGWADITDGVVDWYFPPKEEFKPLYDFVRSHRTLFDPYENVAQVGVVFAERPAAVIGGGPASSLKHVVESLVNLNVPFATAIAGERLLTQRLSPADSQRFEVILVPESARLSGEQQQLVDTWKKQGIAFTVSPKDDVAKLIAGRVTSWVAVESKHDVCLFPRVIPGDKSAPLVCHVVNWNYDPATNQTPPQKDVQISLRTELTGAKVTKVVYHTPEKAAQTLAFTLRDGAVHVIIPGLALWGVLEVRHE